MKRFTGWLITISFLTIFFVVVPSLLYAQADGGCDPLDPACPIDGGVIALLVTGAGYGIKKVIDTKKTKV